MADQINELTDAVNGGKGAAGGFSASKGLSTAGTILAGNKTTSKVSGEKIDDKSFSVENDQAADTKKMLGVMSGIAAIGIPPLAATKAVGSVL